MTVPANTNPLLLRSAAPAAYQISRSLRFNSADSAYLSRTPGSAGSRTTWTWSAWVKRSNLAPSGYQSLFTSTTSGNETLLYFDTSNRLNFYNYSSSFLARKITTAVFRDPSSWYHIVLTWDTTNATAGDRVRIYVNGIRQTVFDTSTDAGSSEQSTINNTIAHMLGSYGAYSNNFFDGYLADIYFLDGTATTPSTFAETDAVTGQWVPKTPTSISYGTNGFRLTFSDNSGTTSTTLGKDAAGSNNWTPNNFSVASGSGNDSLVDSPTSYGTDTGAGGEVRGNYCTLSPLISTSGPISNGNLEMVGANAWRNTKGTISVSTGKWYFEATYSGSQFGSSISNLMAGVGLAKANTSTPNVDVSDSSLYGSILAFSQTGHVNNFNAPTSARSQIANGDVIGFALNYDAGTYTIYVNNTSTSSGSLNFTGELTPWSQAYSSNNYFILNFGQRPFAYTAPSGFKALCDQNLPTPPIIKPANYFDALLWTGNSTNGRAITGLAFQPSFAWIKRRSASYSHLLHDAVRGFNSGWAKQLSTDSTAAEAVGALNGISSFDTGGFTLGVDGGVNFSGSTYVGWCWDAASSNSTNTSGTITSTVRANATAGFSIVTYTGNGSAATVGHGLGAAPSMIISKNRDFSGGTNWQVYHTSLGNTKSINLNTTGTPNTDVGWWNNTSPTSTVYSIGSYNSSNGDKFVAYCFAPVAGYSAFGSYTGNGSSDGPAVWLGFRPRWIMIKPNVSDTYSYWLIDDTARSPYNVAQAKLAANLSDQENSSNIGTQPYDILSNGFKLRTGTGIGLNQNGTQYLYACFAESPFQYARAR